MTARVLEVLGQSAGGVGRHVARVTSSLDGIAGLHIDIAAPSDIRVAMPKKVVPLEVPTGALVGHRRTIRALASIVDRGGYEVVHAHGLRAGIDAALALRSRRVRFLYTVHNVIHPQVSGRLRASVYGRAEPLPVRMSDTTFAASEEIARNILRRAPDARAKVEVLRLGVGELPAPTLGRVGVRRALGVGDEQPLVVTVARLAPQKALHVLIEALALLPEEVVLVLIGDGPLEGRLRSLARARGVAERALFLGYRDDIVDHVAAADVFCLSSVWEAVALAAQEAVQLGIPVVSTDVGGMGELIEDGVSGRLVPPGDPRALARAIAGVLADRTRARAYTVAASATLTERFSTAAMLIRLERAYLEGEDAG
ncbi:MAG: glycosyltransferase family 4 protein [Actinomycetota bacterium]